MPFVKRKKRPEISSPTNFEHRVHSGYDHNTGVFVGLPTQWNSIINETEQQKMLQQQLINNTRLASTRPKPIVDPSRITPSELNCFKTIVRGGSNGQTNENQTGNSTNGIGNGLDEAFGAINGSMGHHKGSTWHSLNTHNISNQPSISSPVSISPTKLNSGPLTGAKYRINNNNGHTTYQNGQGFIQSPLNQATIQHNQSNQNHHLNSILPLVESALIIGDSTTKKTNVNQVKNHFLLFVHILK